MFCRNCGKEIQDGERFCASCGAEQNTSVDSVKIPRSQRTTVSLKSHTVTALLFVFAVLIGGFAFYAEKIKVNPWIEADTFSLDVLKSNVQSFENNKGTMETLNCYTLSKKEFHKLWNNIPRKIIYGGTIFYPFEPEYDKVSDYNDSMQSIMQRYMIICTPLYQYDDGGTYLLTYIINHETNEVMCF